MSAWYVAWLLMATQPDPHAHPEHFGGTRAIAFDEALRLTARAEPLERREAVVRARRAADREVPRLTENPQIVFQPGARVEADAGGEGFSAQGQLTQSWNLRDLGRARRRAMRVETEALAVELRRAALRARLDAARTWLDLHAAERGLGITRRELEVARTMVEESEVAVRAGVLTVVELAEAQQYAASVDARVVDLEGRIHDLGLALALAVGTDPSAPLGTEGAAPEPELPPTPVLAARLRDVEGLPEVVLARLRTAAARAREVEARAQQGTRLTTGVAVMRDGPGELIAQGIVGVTVPLFERGQGAAARARTETGLLDVELATAQRAVQAEIAELLHELQHTALVLERIRTELLPAVRALLEARRAGRLAGETTAFQVLLARRQLLETEARLIEAEAEHTWAEVLAWLFLAELAGEAP